MNEEELAAATIRRSLLQSAAIEGLPGWETRLYLIEYGPGADGSDHTHPVIGLGYVLQGGVVSAFAGELPSVYRAGESFKDETNAVHTVSKNASATEPLRFLVAYTVREEEPVTVQPPQSPGEVSL